MDNVEYIYFYIGPTVGCVGSLLYQIPYDHTVVLNNDYSFLICFKYILDTRVDAYLQLLSIKITFKEFTIGDFMLSMFLKRDKYMIK